MYRACAAAYLPSAESCRPLRLPSVTASASDVVGAALVAVLDLRLREQHEALGAVVEVLRARDVALVEVRRVLRPPRVLVRAPHLEHDLVGLGRAAVRREELVAVENGAVVLSRRRAQDHGVVRGVLLVLELGVVRVLAVPERLHLLGEVGGLGEEPHRLQRGRRDPRALRRLGLVAVARAHRELRGLLQRLGVARELRLLLGVDARLRRARVARELLRRAQVRRRRSRVVARRRLLLALLEHRLHDERIEALLLLRRAEARQRLEPPRPGLDVLVVLRAIERLEDAVARVAPPLAVRELLEQHAPDLHGRVVVAVRGSSTDPAGRTSPAAADRSGRSCA